MAAAWVVSVHVRSVDSHWESVLGIGVVSHCLCLRVGIRLAEAVETQQRVKGAGVTVRKAKAASTFSSGRSRDAAAIWDQYFRADKQAVVQPCTRSISTGAVE